MSSCDLTLFKSGFAYSSVREAVPAGLIQQQRILSCRHIFGTGSRSISLRRSLSAKFGKQESRFAAVVTCKAKNLCEDEFEGTVLKAELPVLVDFWAEWCGPCKLVAPAVDWAAENYAGKLEVYKIDSDKSPALVEKYKPYGLPTLIVFKNGEEVPGSRREGAITKAKLKTYLDELLPTIAA